MKKISIPGAVLGVITLLSGLPASAQNSYAFQMSSSFYAGNAKMPAGSYTLRQMQQESGLYELQNSSGSHSIIVETRPSSKTAKGKPEVLFNKYGTTDYMEAVATSNGTSFDIDESAAEKLAAKTGSPHPHSVPTK